MTIGHKWQISHCVAWASWQALLNHSCGMWLVTEHTDHLLMLRVRLSAVPMMDFLDELNSWVSWAERGRGVVCGAWFSVTSSLPVLARLLVFMDPAQCQWLPETIATSCCTSRAKDIIYTQGISKSKSRSRWIDLLVSLLSVSLRSSFAHDLSLLHPFNFSPRHKIQYFKVGSGKGNQLALMLIPQMCLFVHVMYTFFPKVSVTCNRDVVIISCSFWGV